MSVENELPNEEQQEMPQEMPQEETVNTEDQATEVVDELPRQTAVYSRTCYLF
jgi:hypothetical protein